MALRAREVERLRALGAAYGVAGQIGGLAVLARQGRCLVPDEMLAAAGTDRYGVVADVTKAPVAALAAEGARFLAAGAGRFARSEVAAALPGVLARRDLRRGARVRGLGDRLAVMGAWARGRV
jgi:phytoene synthase